MTTHCYAMTRGRVARFTLLDTKGAPVEGEQSVVVTKGIAAVAINEVVESQGHELVRNDEDTPRVLLRGKNRTIGYTTDISLRGVDPDLLTMLTNQPTVQNVHGDTVGNDIQIKRPVSNFAMEVWTKLAEPVNGYTFGYTLFPRIRGGRLGGFSINNGALDLTIKGARTSRMSKWGSGPYALRWNGGGWDINPWDTDLWDEAVTRCTPGSDIANPFGEWGFGEWDFGGGSATPDPDRIYQRLGSPIGNSTHWRNFLLDWAPSPICGAQPLYDVVDGGDAAFTTEDIIDGEFADSIATDTLEGGYAA